MLGTQQRILDRDYDPVKLQAMMPRMNDRLWVRIKDERPRTPWTFPISIFKDYLIETDAKVTECFECDWACMKFPKMTEQELADVKEELGKSYRLMYCFACLLFAIERKCIRCYRQ